jgi:hypothetical protein
VATAGPCVLVATQRRCTVLPVRYELNLYVTSCNRPRVAVAPSGATEENEERGSPRFKYVSCPNACG